MGNVRALAWIASQSKAAELTMSVCTGALLLARAGLLEGLEATTHHEAFTELADAAPTTRIVRDKRIVDNGRIIVAAGVASGIDASLYVVHRLLGSEAARDVATYIEYPWHASPRI